MIADDAVTPPLAPRIALLSIASFWAFYFAVWSVRGAVLYNHNQTSMLGTRALVSLGSAAVTVIFYLPMRRVMATSLARTIALAAVLALPAAVLYSALNWYMFDHLGEGKAMRWSWSPAPSTMPATSPSPPPTPGSMSVGAGMTPSSWSDDVTPLQAIADQAGNGYFFFIAWAALYLALGYAAKIGALERRTAALRAAAQSAELRALRYQVNPHFLFNTLNSLSSLVLGGKREQAEQMIINLATFFRTSLTGDPTEDVRLSEEINLQRLYLDIERVRFPDRLLVAIDVPDALLDVCIPGLILQPLVENAVKHAVSKSPRAVTIRISAREILTGLAVTVENDGEPLASERVEPGTGVGLRNVRDRLSARYGVAAACQWGPQPGGGFMVHLTLPLVRHGC